MKRNSLPLHNPAELAERRLRRALSVPIALVVGALHFVTGPGYRGPFPQFINGYLIDILLPFAMVLVLGNIEKSWGRSRLLRFICVFGFGAVIETLQYLGVDLLGCYFDPLDYLMYATGAAGAVLLDWVVFRSQKS